MSEFSEVSTDDFRVTTQNPDAEAVRALLQTPAPAETPAPPADAPPPAETTAPPAETPAADEGDGGEELPPAASADRERNADGTFKGRRKSPQQRIDAVVFEREEARREAARLRDEMEALRRQLPAASPQRGVSADDPEPKPDDYADWDEYDRARIAWHVERRFREREAQDAREREERHDYEMRRSYVDREAAYAATVPDYRDTLAKAADVPLNGATRQAIFESERGPALLHYLATHREDAHRWAHADPAALMRELLELKVPSSPAPNGSGSRTTVTVPPPISPVGASPVVAETPTIELPLDEYITRRRAEQLAERKAASQLRR